MTAVSTIPAAAAAQIGIHIMLSFLSPVDTDCVFTALEPEAGAYDLAAEAAALVRLPGPKQVRHKTMPVNVSLLLR